MDAAYFFTNISVSPLVLPIESFFSTKFLKQYL